MAYILQEDNSGDDYGIAAGIYGTWYLCQTFTASSSYGLKMIALPLCSEGTPPQLYVEIWSTSGGEPDSMLKSHTVVAELPIYNSHDWTEFVFGTAQAVIEGQVYTIVIKSDGGGDGDNRGRWWYDTSGSWAGAEGWTNDSGGTWHMTASADHLFKIYSEATVPAQPTNPSPGHEETGVEFPTTPLSYTASDDPPADTYDIYFRIQGGAYTKIAETEDITSWRMPYNILNIKDYNPAAVTGYRSPVAGDVIYDDTDSYTIAYVTVGDLINVQYQAKLYAFRTTGPGGKSPGDVLTNGVAPDVENPQAVRVTLNDQLFFHGVVEEIYLPPGTTFEWRVDATNEVGTTEGNVWEFTTQTLKIPKVSYVLIAGGSGTGPYDYPPGEEGTDWNWTGENNMMAVRRLIAAADNKIWIEDI